MHEFAVGDMLEMRKPHPCGGTRWAITRIGADIGLRCLTCGRRVMLPRSTVERRMRQHLDAQGQPKPPRTA